MSRQRRKRGLGLAYELTLLHKDSSLYLKMMKFKKKEHTAPARQQCCKREHAACRSVPGVSEQPFRCAVLPYDCKYMWKFRTLASALVINML